MNVRCILPVHVYIVRRDIQIIITSYLHMNMNIHTRLKLYFYLWVYCNNDWLNRDPTNDFLYGFVAEVFHKGPQLSKILAEQIGSLVM